MKISIIIPNWNGELLLKKNLPSVIKTNPDEIIIVDDASGDNSVELLEREFPEIILVKHEKNLGFAVSCNDGVKKAKGEIIVLLNLDVVPEKNFLEPLKEDFDDPLVFAVSLHEPQWSWARGSWSNGFINHEPGEKTDVCHVSFWASGGSAAFRKNIWDKLGGFDDIYYPFYWEDIDLSYRAWKRGYQIMWDPRSIVHHKHEGTIGKHFSKKYVDSISERNRLIFIWKNILSPKMIVEHKLGILRRLITGPGYIKPLILSMIKIPRIIPRKIKEYRERKISDKEIFDRFK